MIATNVRQAPPESASGIVFETERLILRRLTQDDAAFIVELLNDPDWLRHIGDRGVRTDDDARAYLARGPIDLYARLGFGPYMVLRKADGAATGICGPVKRDALDDVDLGFAFLPRYRASGYAREAAEATLAHAREVLRLPRIVAIASPDNAPSIRLLERLAFRFERKLRLKEDDDELMLFGLSLSH